MEKTKNLLACAILFLLLPSKSIAQEPPAPTTEVTASAYAAFLNAEAASDPDSLYDSAMEVDLGAACIKRQGTPGDWHYQAIEAIEEKKNSSATFLSRDDVARYCAWTGDPNFLVTWQVEVDPALKSNRASFSIFRTQEGLLKMSGGEVEYAWSTFLEEALLITGMMGGEARSRGEEEQTASRITPQEEGRERGSEDLSALLTPAPTLHLTLTEDAEQVRMRRFFIQEPSREDYYKTADALLPKAEQAWKARAAALQTYQLKKEALEQAHEKFEKEKALLAEKDLSKTFAGRVAKILEGGSALASDVSAIASGALKGASILFDLGNQFAEKYSYNKAERYFTTATAEEGETCHLLDAAEKKAFLLDYERKEPEEKAREAQEQAVLAEAKQLKPPIQSKQEDDWQTWAQELHRESSQAEAKAFAKKAVANPTWAAHQAAAVWTQRMTQVEQDLAAIEQEQQQMFAPLEATCLSLQQKAEEARSTAIAAQDRHDQMVNVERAAQEEYDRLRAYLRDLEGQKPKTPALSQAIGLIKKESGNAFAAWKQAEKELQAHEKTNQELIKETEAKACDVEAQALELFQQKEQLEKRYKRKMERTKAQLQADQRAWKEVWPEEVLYQKLQQKCGEMAFATAAIKNSKETWSVAQEEAEELEALWGRMKNVEQEQLWRGRANRAAIKRTFLEIQELWNSFSDAVQTLVVNSNLDVDADAENSKDVVTRGKNIALVIEKAAPLIDDILFPTKAINGVGMNLMSRSIRNVVHVAKMTSNCSKPIAETAWRDVINVTKNMSAKALDVVETTPPTWQEEVAWVAKAIQEAGIFATSIAEPTRLVYDNLFHPTELKKLREMVVIMKNIYQKQVRYRRARKNFIWRALEPQRESLVEKKESFSKKDRHWKGERGLLNARINIRENLDDGMETDEEEFDLFEDIPIQESRLGEERAILNQEKKAIDEREEALKQRELKLEEDAKAMDQKAAMLADETTRVAAERARLAQEQKQTEEASEELTKKREALKIEEARILQEREALAKEAESLEALASTELDQKTWNHLLERIHQAIEQEKRALLEAEALEEIDKATHYLEAHHAALTAQQLWEEVIQKIDEQERKAQSSLEKQRLALEKSHAQKEKESWQHRAAEYLAKVEKEKEKEESSQQEQRFNYDEKLAELRGKIVKMEELKQEALANGDREKAKRLADAAEVLSPSNKYSQKKSGAIWAYQQAAEEEAQGNRKVAAAWDEVAKAYEDQAKALANGDSEQAKRYKKAAELLSSFSEYGHKKEFGVVWACQQAMKEESQGNKNVIATWDRVAEAYKKQAEALADGNLEKEKFCKQAAELLGSCNEYGYREGSGVIWAYKKAAEQAIAGNKNIEAIWDQAAKAYEKQANTLMEGKELAVVEKWQKIGNAYKKAALAYEKMVKQKADNNKEAEENYCKSGEAYEGEAQALLAGDQEIAEKQRKMGLEYRVAASCYEEFGKDYGEYVKKKREGELSSALKEADQTSDLKLELSSFQVKATKAMQAAMAAREKDIKHREKEFNGLGSIYYWCWDYTAAAWKMAGKSWRQAAQCQSAGDQTLSDSWQKVAEVAEQGAKRFEKIVPAYAAGHTYMQCTPDYFSSAESLSNAARAMEKVIEWSNQEDKLRHVGNAVEADLWQEAVQKAKINAASYQNAAENHITKYDFEYHGSTAYSSEKHADAEWELVRTMGEELSFLHQEGVDTTSPLATFKDALYRSKESSAAALEALNRAQEIAKTGSEGERQKAWQEALELAKKTAEYWKETVVITPQFNRPYWTQYVETNEARWKTHAFFREENQFQDAVVTARAKALATPIGSQESVILWEKAFQLAEQAAEQMKEIVNSYRFGVEKAQDERIRRLFEPDWRGECYWKEDLKQSELQQQACVKIAQQQWSDFIKSLAKQEEEANRKMIQLAFQIKSHEPLEYLQLSATHAAERSAAAKNQQENSVENKEQDDWKNISIRWEETTQAWQKAKEFLAQGNQDLMEYWEKMAKHYQFLASFLEQITMEEQVERDEEQAEIYEEQREVVQQASPFVAESYHQLNAAARTAEKVVEAQKNGDQEAVILWKKIIECYQRTAEYNRQAVVASMRKYKKQATLLQQAADGRPNSYCKERREEALAEALKKATEAEEQNHREVGVLWKKIADRYQLSIDCLYLSDVKEDLIDGVENHFQKIGNFASESTSVLTRAIHALEEAVEAKKGKRYERATQWEKIAEQYQCLSKHWDKAVIASIEGKQELAKSLDDLYSSKELEEAEKALEEEAKAEGKKDHKQMAFWRKIAEEHQLLAGYGIQAAANLLQTDKEQIAPFDYKAYNASLCASREGFMKTSKMFQESLKAENKNRHEEAAIKENCAELYQVAAKYYSQAAEAWIQGRKERAACLDKAGASIRNGIFETRVKSHAENSNHPEVASLVKKMNECYELALRYCYQAAEAWTQGRKEEAACLDKAGASIRSSIFETRVTSHSGNNHHPEVALLIKK